MAEAAAVVGAQDATRTGQGGTYRVTLAYRRRRKNRKWWEVRLWQLAPIELFWGLIRYWRWRCIRSETQLRRLQRARDAFEQMKAEAEELSRA